MFIGASPGSFGGGIKTNTFVLIVYSFSSTIRGKKMWKYLIEESHQVFYINHTQFYYLPNCNFYWLDFS